MADFREYSNSSAKLRQLKFNSRTRRMNKKKKKKKKKKRRNARKKRKRIITTKKEFVSERFLKRMQMIA